MRVAVVGLGKAGLPLAAVIADSGIEVVGVDVSSERVSAINKGENPIPEEPELSGLIQRHAGNNLVATSDYKDAASCEAFIVIVPLFIDEQHKPDFSILEKAFKGVAGVASPGALVVLETTVPPGTTERMVAGWLSGKKCLLAYSPERIMTGYSVSRYREFPKVVGGVTPEAGERAFELYSRFCKAVHKVSDAKTAELIKVAEGVYRDANIAIANELFKVSETLGVNFFEVRKYANHEFCHIHAPGNVGGHCIPVYPWFLINDYDVPLIKLAREQNDSMIEYYADKVLGKPRVLVIGLTFREGVKELAYTRGIPMIRLLKARGHEVFVWDPMYTKEEILSMGYSYPADFASMDAIILMNNYANYKRELSPFKGKIVDVKGVFNDSAVH